MKNHLRLTGLSILLLGVASCGPLQVYYSPAKDQTRTNDDTVACKVKALKDAPVANEIRQNPPIYHPGVQHCANGKCWTGPGYWVDGAIYTVDQNLGLRRQVETTCMLQKGYQQLELPRCKQEQIAALSSLPRGTVNGSGRSSGLPADACAVHQNNGSTIILPPL